MKQELGRGLITWLVVLLLAAGAAHACAIVCNVGTQLVGGTSDPSTVKGGTALAYTVYATDKDQPQFGGAETMDLTLWNSDHIIESIPVHTITRQGDDQGAGKRTWTVSGMAATFSGDNICYDKYRFDDYPGNSLEASGGQYIYADDDPGPNHDDWYVKTVIVNQN